MEHKILNLIPENMQEDLIKEVQLILKERAEKEANKLPTKEAIEEVLKNIV